MEGVVRGGAGLNACLGVVLWMLIDVVTRCEVSPGRRKRQKEREGRFFRLRLRGWAQFRMMTDPGPLSLGLFQPGGAGIVPIYFSVFSCFPSLLLCPFPFLCLPLSLYLVSCCLLPLFCLSLSPPLPPRVRHCQSLPLPWRHMQLLLFNRSFFSGPFFHCSVTT